MILPAVAVDNPGILHICSDYAKQRLYSELFSSLSALGMQQFVYVPVRSAVEIGKYRLDDDELSFRYAQVLRKYHRLLFRLKISTVFDDINRNVDLEQFGLVHAHFLYSDGAVARAIQHRSGIPYVVSVRNTDLNFFMKWRPDLRRICWDILRHASKVSFLSPAYMERMSELVPAEIRDILRSKAIVIPNGLDSLWLEHGMNPERPVASTLRVLYVGDFSANKNILNTMKAVRLVSQEVPVTLTLVGGGGDQEEVLRQQLKSGAWPFVTHLDRIDDRLRMRDTFRSHDIFVMPSLLETFGLVYIEALSQGLPVVHSRGQGVDGYFPEGEIAASVDPHSPAAIAAGILALAKRLPATRPRCVAAATRFAWPDIAMRYQDLYLWAASERTSVNDTAFQRT